MTHCRPGAHAAPQEPQLSTLELVFTQLSVVPSPQSVRPAEQQRQASWQLADGGNARGRPALSHTSPLDGMHIAQVTPLTHQCRRHTCPPSTSVRCRTWCRRHRSSPAAACQRVVSGGQGLLTVGPPVASLCLGSPVQGAPWRCEGACASHHRRSCSGRSRTHLVSLQALAALAGAQRLAGVGCGKAAKKGGVRDQQCGPQLSTLRIPNAYTGLPALLSWLGPAYAHCAQRVPRQYMHGRNSLPVQMQAPAWHLALEPQLTPQAPQLELSACVFLHLVPHRVGEVVGQPQVPALQV